jgi:type II restriction enzyme
MSDIYSFNSQENQLIETIKNAYYMQPVISKIDAIFADKEKDIMSV